MLVIPDSISNKVHVSKLDELANKRFEDLDLMVLMVYLINTVPASALPVLGEQFDVMGFKGWRYADTEQKKRDLLKKAIELHRYKGTPWSIKEALKAIGVDPVIIAEGAVIFYDGSIFYNGSQTYGGGSWANFRVLMDEGSLPVMTPALIAEMRYLILEYKNARSHLVDIGVLSNASDSVTVDDSEFTMEFNLTMVDVVMGPVYDGAFDYDAEIPYGNFDDELVYS